MIKLHDIHLLCDSFGIPVHQLDAYLYEKLDEKSDLENGVKDLREEQDMLKKEVKDLREELAALKEEREHRIYRNRKE